MGGDMRLRNKKTGETRVFYYLHPALPNGSVILGLLDDDGESQTHTYGSLADFNEEWEDYEPAELEIADETARETIRKWYNKNRIVGKLRSYGGGSWLGLRGDDKSGCSWRIELCVDYSSKLISGKLYSLNELCGEEEE